MAQKERQESHIRRTQGMQSSYRAEDVTLLLKDTASQRKPSPTKEGKVDTGGEAHCEMLPH